ncbi:MAG TPA: fluoride efflux transporter CrcB [Chitinophagales bacterium]|nr:fluoride efflux transporter CrcB [Chitinophagales bacterium]HRK27918.1 fluoride efflux transporter CrcB [Chitinophagales bacterium]
MTDYILVFAGGGLGSMARFLLSQYNATTLTILPLGTIAANIASSFILGLVVGLFSGGTDIPPSWRVFIAVGFCGGFSTFSTFSFETFYFIKTGQPLYALLNVVCNLMFCIMGVYAGFTLTAPK